MLLVACATAVPPTPQATPTPLGGIALSDMEGWWTCDTSIYAAWRLGHDGYGEMFYNSPMTRYERPYVWLTFVPTEGGIEVHEPRRTWDGCTGMVGLYSVHLESSDTMRFQMITDDCSGRSASYDGAVFTRHPVLGSLMGTWNAQSKDETRLFVREDMCICVQKGRGPTTETLLEGTLTWDMAYKHFELQGTVTDPCGATKVGKYTVKVKDGTMTWTCLEDLCANRQSAMLDWGPYTRDDELTQLAGFYTSGSRYVLELRPGGMFVMRDGESHNYLIREGIYDVQGQTLTLVDRTGEARCQDEVGEYGYRLQDGVLTLKVDADRCAMRSSLLHEHPEWELVTQTH